MFTRALLMAGMILAAAATSSTGSPENYKDVRSLAERTVAADGPAAESAIAELRAAGPSSLDSLFAMRDRIVGSHGASSKAGSAETAADSDSFERKLRKLESVIDRVAGQRYAHVSRLFWYTDLDEAKAAAAASRQPILSLRMLGNLTDEFSCANSRFFRTTLYVNEEVGKRLRENFVLHWQSVRPVPRVTIDFGDGRKLERTITGNSAHYAVAADGTPLDVLPGLYGPSQFLAWLDDVEALHCRLAQLSPAERETPLRQYHAERATAIADRWANDLKAVAPESTICKRDSGGALTTATTDEHWKKIALLPNHAVGLDDNSYRIIRKENPDAIQAGEVAITKSNVETSILRLVSALRRSIAEDGVRNEYLLHRQVHDWFAGGQVTPDVERLNDRVYAELFLMPASDPWLGLAPTDAYTALDGGGVAVGR